MKRAPFHLLITSFVAWAALALMTPVAYPMGFGGGLQVQTFPEHSRIFIPLDPSVDTHLKPTSKGFELFIQGVSVSDLGAPVGEEGAWEARFAHIQDPRLSALHFADVAGGVKVTGVWRFPQGKLALAHPTMETFDFRQGDQDSQAQNPGYVLDFWLKKGSMTVEKYKARQLELARLAKLRQEEMARQQVAERRIASEKRLAEIEDTTRFCKQPLNENNDIFLQFYPIHRPVDFRRWFPDTTPDEYMNYELPQADDSSPEATDSARYAHLAMDLYRQGKVALVLRTLDFFAAAHPHSDYQPWMMFLRANAMIKLGLNKKAEQILANLMVDSEKTQVSLYAAMYLAEKQIERKQTLEATSTFLWLIAHFPNYKHAWLFHLGAAEMLYAIRQTDRALKEYEWVAEKAPDTASRAEGALRAPDLYLQRFQYAQALAGYYQAIHYFPDQAKNFPSVFLNRAESLYGLGQFDRAQQAFQDFLKDFPIHPAGWRATFRLGEIDGRKPDGAVASNSKDSQSSRHWFYETVNRFPFSPGATLARLRLIACGDHGGFDLQGAQRFFDNDVDAYDGGGEVDVVPFHAMATLAHIRALVAFGQETDAVDLATNELTKPGNVEMHDILRGTIGSVFRKSILDLLSQGKKYEALAFYKQKAAFLNLSDSKTQSPEETDYLLKLSQAASDLGLGELAKEISDAYAKANSGREVAAASGQDLDSILRSSEQHFTTAKALWVASGMKQESAIRAQLAQVHEESPYSYQRELILGLMDQNAGRPEAALSHAVRAQLLIPAGATGPNGISDPRVLAWIAGLQADAGRGPADWQAALDMYRNLEKHIQLVGNGKPPVDPVAASVGIPPVPSLDATVLAEGRLLEKLGKWGAAASTYARAMDEKVGGDEAVYQYARSLEKTGSAADQAKAHDVLVRLANGPAPRSGAKIQDDFWKKLARQALADETISKP